MSLFQHLQLGTVFAFLGLQCCNSALLQHDSLSYVYASQYFYIVFPVCDYVLTSFFPKDAHSTHSQITLTTSYWVVWQSRRSLFKLGDNCRDPVPKSGHSHRPNESFTLLVIPFNPFNYYYETSCKQVNLAMFSEGEYRYTSEINNMLRDA